MLELRDLEATAESFELKLPELRVAPRGLHVLAGPNGSGKTMLLEVVAGLRALKKGSVRLAGVEIAHLPPERRAITYLPQDHVLFPHMNVEKNLYFPWAFKKDKPSFAERELASDVVEWLELGKLLNRAPATLSGGEKQRVALARALLSGRRFLLLDEPAAAIHDAFKPELYELLRAFQRRYELSVLLVSHDVDYAFPLADEVSILIDGRLRQSEPFDRLLRRPADWEVARFLGVRNLWHTHLAPSADGAWEAVCEVLERPLKLPSGATPPPEGYPYLGLRSEHVAIGEALPRGEGQELVALNGVISHVVPRIADVVIRLRVASGEIEARVPWARAGAARDWAPGRQACALFPLECLFIVSGPARGTST
jgi:molybdate/tungstate transport system ATP-binding protein